jgi:hypothetical protein
MWSRGRNVKTNTETLRAATRLATVISGALIGVLALFWILGTFLLSNEGALFFVFVAYTAVLFVVAFQLLRGAARPVLWSAVAACLPFAPLAFLILFSLFQPPAPPSEGPSGLPALLFFAGVTAVALIATGLNWAYTRSI